MVKQAGLIAEAGDLTVEGNAILTINPGFTLNVTRKLTQYGKITGGGTAVIQDMDWYSGWLDNVQATLNGVLTAKGTGNKYVYSTTLTVAAGARVVQEATASNVNIYGMPATPATIENLGTWDLQGDAGLDHYAMIPPEIRGTFHNAAGATFKKTGGTGQSQIHVTFDNDGVVEVHTGELEMGGRDSQASLQRRPVPDQDRQHARADPRRRNVQLLRRRTRHDQGLLPRRSRQRALRVRAPTSWTASTTSAAPPPRCRRHRRATRSTTSHRWALSTCRRATTPA